MTPKITIAADAPLTAQAGADIAKAGGNVVDVAVGAALVAMVTEVLMCSLGGSAFVMIGRGGQDAELIDGADAMPETIPPEPNFSEAHLPYGDGITVRHGHGTIAVPGALAALECAWRRHGTLPWKDVLTPAIEAAKNPCQAGLPFGTWLAVAGKKVFYSQAASRACFFPDGQNPIKTGDAYILPHMADTLAQLAEESTSSLYGGDLGVRFAREVQEHGGCVTLDDFRSYRATVRKPVTFKCSDFLFHSNPPPAVGGSALKILMQSLQSQWHQLSSQAHKVRCIADAQAQLLSLKNSAQWLKQFGPGSASASTTHLSVVNDEGDGVGITMSNGYGSGIVIPGTGIICNASLGEPELNPGGYYRQGSGARLVSNMAPTLATHPDRSTIVMGSPGACRITTAIAQMWLQFGFEDCDLPTAIHKPRLHVEAAPEGLRVLCEPGLDTSLLSADFSIREYDDLDMFFGALKVCASHRDGTLEAIADTRRHGAIATFP